jgi:hypothetical protein
MDNDLNTPSQKQKNGIISKPDFRGLKEGDQDTYLNHKVETLIMKDDEFIVYLDESYFVEWMTSDEYDTKHGWAENYSIILNKVALLETKSEILLSEKQLPSFRRLLGEAVATLLDAKDTQKAEAFLVEADLFMQQRINEKTKQYTITSSVFVLFLIIGLGYLLWSYQWAISIKISADIYEIINLSLYGALGAFLSIVSRTKESQIDPSASLLMHCLDSFLRVLVGIIGAFFIIVILKAKIITSSIIPTDNSWLVYIAFAIAAGSSERLVPSVIKKIEETSFDVNIEVNKTGNITTRKTT